MSKIDPPEGYTPSDSTDFDDLLSLSYKTREDLDVMTLATGIQYFYCHEFDYDSLLSIRLTGQEIDGEADTLLYRENLDYSIKNM
jgi:hypothetical protein